MKVHPAAEIFPAMSGEEFESLKNSIKESGLLVPITIWNGELLDGRNRERACRELGITPKTVEFSGDDPVAFVLSMNLSRRHLDESQRAIVAGRLANLSKGQKKSDSPIGLSQSEAAAKLNVGMTSVKRAKEVIDTGVPALVSAVETGKIAVSEAAQIATLPAEDQYEVITLPKKERKQQTEYRAKQTPKYEPPAPLVLTGKTAKTIEAYYTVESWTALTAKERAKIIDAGFETSATMNKQDGDSIEWARHSLNTVTGCLHDCPYCYARDIAERYMKQGFAPSFYPSRLAAPGNHKIPAEAASDPSFKNIFANSMSDLFGKWVPKDWIDATIQMVRRNPEWNFLFLTKFPQRAAEFSFPDNWWMGTSVDAQARVSNAEKAFERIECKTKWLSCEPLLEPIKFSKLELFQWVVIGGASRSNRTPEWNPPFDWLASLHIQARAAGCKVYHKSNCGLLDSMRVREFPWSEDKLKSLPKEFRYLKGMERATA